MAKSYAEERLELVENLWFNVIAEEPNAIAKAVRFFIGYWILCGCSSIINMGENSTDLGGRL